MRPTQVLGWLKGLPTWPKRILGWGLGVLLIVGVLYLGYGWVKERIVASALQEYETKKMVEIEGYKKQIQVNQDVIKAKNLEIQAAKNEAARQHEIAKQAQKNLEALVVVADKLAAQVGVVREEAANVPEQELVPAIRSTLDKLRPGNPGSRPSGR
jgi:hypothetical protein